MLYIKKFTNNSINNQPKKNQRKSTLTYYLSAHYSLNLSMMLNHNSTTITVKNEKYFNHSLS